MSSVRRIVAVLTATVLAAFTAVTPAFAGPAPLIEPAPAPAGGGSGPSGWLLESWSQAAMVTVAAITVLVLVVVAMVSRTRHHHTPSVAFLAAIGVGKGEITHQRDPMSRKESGRISSTLSTQKVT